MKKYRIFTNFEKEEAWLNEMAQNGWFFVRCTPLGSYCFEKGKPKITNYRIDYRMFNKREDFAEYIQLFADSGWRHIYGTRHTGSQYFAPQNPNADADIFSDNASKIGRYRRLSEMWTSLLTVYTMFFVSLYSSGSINLSSLFNLKELYYTPGLWDMSGAKFWRAFLFETPFALGRGFSWFFLIVMIGVSLYFSVRASVESKKEKR